MQPCMKSQMLRKDKTELAPALASAGDGNARKMTKKKKKDIRGQQSYCYGLNYHKASNYWNDIGRQGGLSCYIAVWFEVNEMIR